MELDRKKKNYLPRKFALSRLTKNRTEVIEEAGRARENERVQSE